MRPGEPSRTALGAAVHRALHQELEGGRVFADPLALRIVAGETDRLAAADSPERRPLRLFVAARHRFAEDALAQAVRRGTRQVVVLGAGLDTFAYRNPYADVAVFEVDHPDTGAWKRERLAAAGIGVPASLTYVAVDFEREDALDVLRATPGFEATRPAYFLWLGVVPYLTWAAVTRTLAAIASVPGAEVVLDYAAPPDGPLEGAAAVAAAAFAARVAAVGEPVTPPVPVETMAATVRDLGFDDVEDLGRSEIRTRFLGLGPVAGGGGGHLLRARRTVSP